MKKSPAFLRISAGQCVRRWREQRGWAASELAKRAGVSKAYLSDLENDKTQTPGNEKLVQLAHGLAIPPEYIHDRVMPEDVEAGKDGDQEASGVVGPERDVKREAALEAVLINTLVVAFPDVDLTPGQQIDDLLASASLSDDEVQVIAEHLVTEAGRLLALLSRVRR